jgi:WD40 repeat protein
MSLTRASLVLGWLLLGIVAATAGDNSGHTDRYGDALPPGAAARLGRLRFPSKTNYTDLALSPDGKELALGCDDRTVHFWELTSGKELRQFRLREASADFLAYSPDGTVVAASGKNGPIELCEAATGRTRVVLRLSEGPLYCLAFAPAGQLLLAGGKGDTIRAWDATSGKERFVLTGHKDSVRALAFSADGKRLASLHQDDLLAEDGVRPLAPEERAEKEEKEEKSKRISLWDLTTGKLLRTVDGPARYAHAVALSRQGDLLATGHACALLRIWDVVGEKELHRLECPRCCTNLVHFVDDRQVLSAGSDGLVRFWDVARGTEQRAVRAARGFRESFLCGPNGQVLASLQYQGVRAAPLVRVWDLVQEKDILPGHSAFVCCLADAPNGKVVVSASKDQTIRLWDPATGKEAMVLAPAVGRDEIACIAISPDSQVLACGFGDSSGNRSFPCRGVQLWDLTTGKELRELPNRNQAPIDGLSFSPDGNLLAVASEGSIHLCDPRSGEEVRACGRRLGGSVAFSPDGKILAAGGSDAAVWIWDVEKGKEVRHWEAHPGGVQALGFSPDGQTLATGGRDKLVRVWDLSGKEAAVLAGVRHAIRSLTFSPDGKVLVAGETGEHLFHVWELATRQEVRPPQRYGSREGRAVAGLAFSPDGRRLATANWDGTVLLWDLWDPANWEAAAAREITTAEVRHLWDEMGGARAPDAYRAMSLLSTVPEQASLFLRTRLKPEPPRDVTRIHRLIADLDSSEFATRETAARELQKCGGAAETELRQVLQGAPSAEVRRRVETLLDPTAPGSLRASSLRPVRAIQVLDRIRLPEAREVLEILARGEPLSLQTREAVAALKRWDQRGKTGP